MKLIGSRTRNFLKRLHQDESAPGTVEWILMVIVALIVMAGIYFLAQWVLQGGAEEAKDVNKARDAANTDVDNLKSDLGVK